METKIYKDKLVIPTVSLPANIPEILLGEENGVILRMAFNAIKEGFSPYEVKQVRSGTGKLVISDFIMVALKQKNVTETGWFLFEGEKRTYDVRQIATCLEEKMCCRKALAEAVAG